MPQVEDTLRELNGWYNELPGGTVRPLLLSKLAVLELCGWIEQRLDELVLTASDRVGLGRDWVAKEVVGSNFGFSYNYHLRRMLCQVVGESAMNHVEATLESDSPGKLEQLKVALGNLWKARGVLAHTHSADPVAKQQSINAPSWSINQHRLVAKMLDQFEASMCKGFQRTIAKP